VHVESMTPSGAEVGGRMRSSLVGLLLEDD
jgi:hypothetical protein